MDWNRKRDKKPMVGRGGGKGKIAFPPFRKALRRKRRDKPFTWNVKKNDRCLDQGGNISSVFLYAASTNRKERYERSIASLVNKAKYLMVS